MRLILGDCLEEMPKLPGGSVDLIVTDPPYFRVKGEPWDRQWADADKYLEWLDRCLIEWVRLLKPNGSLYCFASSKMQARVQCLIGERMNVLNGIVWAKNHTVYGCKGRASSKESLRSYFPETEHIIFAEQFEVQSWFSTRLTMFGITRKMINAEVGSTLKGGGMASHYFGQTDQYELPTASCYDKMHKKWPDAFNKEYEELRRPFNLVRGDPFTDVWDFEPVRPFKGKHPCEKPPDMLKHIVKTSSREGAVVLDCFMGTGNVGGACAELGRDFIGIEAVKKYYDEAALRLQGSNQRGDKTAPRKNHGRAARRA